MIPTHLRDVLSIAGGVLAIGGGVLMFCNSPQVESGIDGGNASTDFAALARAASMKRNLAKIGLALVVIGSVMQVATNFMAAPPN